MEGITLHVHLLFFVVRRDHYCMFFRLPHRMLPETVGNLYVGGYERPFATINVKVLIVIACDFIMHSNVYAMLIYL